MSKITKALEKAARERLLRHQERPTVTVKKAAEIRLVAPTDDAPGITRAVTRLTIDPHLVAAADPQSPISEQYRILRTNLQSLRRVSEARVLLVTSSIHGEGKSVTAINLAMTLAQQEGLRVLLVDADLRRSTVHQWLGLDNEAGLSTALTNGGNLDNLVVKLENPPLSILPAGPAPKHPAELLDSTTMKRLLERFRSQYDVTIIDSPPALPVADPGILGRQADGVLFIVRSGKTQQRTVMQAFSLLKQAKARVIGSVLTHVEHYLPGYYKYYQYYRSETKDGNGKPNGKSASIKAHGPSREAAVEKATER